MKAVENILKPNHVKMKERLILLIWVLSYFAFLFVGAVFMTLIERDRDKELKNSKRIQFLSVLRRYNISTNSTMLINILESALDTNAVGALIPSELDKEVQSNWNIESALFFASTIVTTIGYGNMFPRTIGGRWFVIVYAFLGIPFTGVVIGKIGKRLTELIKKLDNFFAKPVKKIVGAITVEKKLKFYIRIIQLSIVFFIFLLLFWIMPAIAYMLLEDWDINTSIYFCFITISTIGLGDVIPAVDTNVVKKVTILFYFILGLSALSIILNLVKSLLDIIASRAKEKAESLRDHVTGNMKEKSKRISMKLNKVLPVLSLNNHATKTPQNIEIGQVPEEEAITRTDKSTEQEIKDNYLDTLLNQPDNEPALYLGFDEEQEMNAKEKLEQKNSAQS